MVTLHSCTVTSQNRSGGLRSYLCYLCEGGLRVSGDEQLVRVLQVGHLHVNIEPGDGSLRAETPLQLLCWDTDTADD